MRDLSIWSLNLGRWGQTRVRLHALFLLFGVLTIFLSSQSDDSRMLEFGLLSLAILFISVLIHEIGHCLAAHRLGETTAHIILGPLGGLAPAPAPNDPHCQLLVALGGPIANLAVVVVSAVVLLTQKVPLIGLLSPLSPEGVLIGTRWLIGLKLFFWINWILLLVNLIPAFPMDGGRALRSLLWPSFGYHGAAVLVARIAQITAVLLCLVGWVLPTPETAPILPVWVPLTLLAIFLFFSAKAELEKIVQHNFGEQWLDREYSDGFENMGREEHETVEVGPGPIRRWLDKRRDEKIRLRTQIEEEEEWRVDDILARLNEEGIHSLSPEDRAILNRVSVRYRAREDF